MGFVAAQYKSGAANYLFAARDLFQDHAFLGTIIVRRFFCFFACTPLRSTFKPFPMLNNPPYLRVGLPPFANPPRSGVRFFVASWRQSSAGAADPFRTAESSL